MEDSQSPNNTPNKRLYQRYIVNLKGRCCDAQKKCSAVEIRDFCLGGMYIAYAPTDEIGTPHHLSPSVGDVIDILFNLPVKPVKKIHFRAHVVRSDLNSLGVSFIEPNREFLQYTIKYAKWYQVRHEIDVAVSAQVKGVHSKEKMIETIRNKATNPIRVLVDTYLLRQSKTLMDMADKSDNISDQNVYFEAIEVFNKKRSYFRETFITSMNGIVNAQPEVMIDDTNDDSTLSASALSLVEDDAIDDWIARSDITAKSESFFHDELIGLERRLSILYGMSIGKDNNPIGPAAFSRAFQDTIKRLGIGKRAYLVCCKIFRDVLKDGLGDFYEDVNNYLVKNDVLTEVHYEIKKAADEGVEPSRKKSTPKQEHVTVDTAEHAIVDHGIVEHDDSGNLYDLISNLQNIKKSSSPKISTTASSAGETPLHTLNNEELIGMLSQLVSENIGTQSIQPSNSNNLESLTLQMLQKLQTMPGGQQVGPREEGIMETTGSIYQSLFNDNLITHGVKDWLSDVELPLLKEAIKDESVLAD
ncbi:DUF1631 family protein, partial [Pseudomonadota bacterium]